MLKTILGWIALLSSVPTAIIVYNSVGVMKSISTLILIIFVVIVWRWRDLINYVRNTESIHSHTILNENGDVLYERQTSLLPLLWPVKESELFISLSVEI